MNNIYSFDKEPEFLICDLINRSNGTSFKKEHFDFGEPYVRADGRCSVSIIPKENTGWSGSKEVNYSRVDLTYFFASQGVLLKIDPTTLVDGLVTPQLILSNLLSKYGLFLREDQIYLSFLNQPDPKNSTIIRTFFTITAKPNNLVWEGTFVGEYIIGTGINEVVFNPDLDGINNPDGLTQTTFPIEYLYYDKIDGTAFADLLTPFVQGFIFDSPDTTGYWILGQDLTGDIWKYVSSATEEYNIYGATVQYNGLATGEWELDTAHTHVLVIGLETGYNLAASGRLIIPYNMV